ncbi:putative transcriptional regulator, AraC family [Cupriavidus taiwanensis]|uniref:Transcriptional regulator, AraC family n=1 Tax=Cupriavidus taiwanensis TaxID=164546 RepID=A0A976G3S7_9BURK|nr:helix-turn-helix domain-containing protein [Cupriavidus taiwanensis]SOZ63252.1 putative transcriptional regulator, AraC family [Cupriavidus taiwanensis]SOZ64163.1 putative transcriptional regulator, AraC family [Cupriavidus taiwanensis]SOZ67896.1 putative transcriptional regulator, AraC family [Cupriavidus taiwanensis]SPA07803.1 putative transcriptional regulator, AraC family [Cupriavidus taiwanensis]
MPAPTASATSIAPSSQNVPLHVRLLWLPQAMPGSLFTTLDVLRTVAGVASLQHPGATPTLSWQLCGANGRTLATELPGLVSSTRRARAPGSRTLLVIPALLASNAPQLGELVLRDAAALRLVERHARAGGWIAACASGMALPLQLGLLDGATVGAPWMFQSWMARQYPHCDLASDAAMSVHGQVFSCVAPALQVEFMLRVLGHLHDPDLAQAASRLMLFQPERQRSVPALVSQRWLGRTADSPVYRAIQWLRDQVSEPYRLAAVAQAAAVSERTLLRHFRQVTGMTPLDYLHTLRVERARMLLEVTLHGTHAIAEACGYSDAAAFRRLFQRATGMSMSDYRARFALRARRRYWRMEDTAVKRAPQRGAHQ